MPELRWILAAAGVVFLIALAVWESRRQRRLPPQDEEPTQHRFREPTLGLPEIRPREAAPELPVVEIDESMIGLRADGVRIEEDLVAVDAPAQDAEPIADEPPTVSLRGEPPTLDSPAEPAEPIVEWPPENERRLVTVRVVAKTGERLAGRAVRLALAAEGFVHGKFAIFHKPDADGYVVVSAASLSKPGNFDLNTMDSQRYGGLGLFTVLPGRLAPREMVDELVESARNLGARLDAIVQDEHAAPLDAERIAALRSAADAPAASSGDSPDSSS